MKPRWMCTGDVRFCRKFEFRKTAIFVHKIDRGLDSAEYLLFAESVIAAAEQPRRQQQTSAHDHRTGTVPKGGAARGRPRLCH
jgi:hypothetical protein